MSLDRPPPAASTQDTNVHTNGWGPSHMKYSVDIQPSPPAHRQTYSVDVHQSPPPLPSRHTHQTSSSSFAASQDFSIAASRYDPYGNGSPDRPLKMQRRYSQSSLDHQSHRSRRVTSPELQLQGTHPPSPYHSSPSHQHNSRVDSHVYQSNPRHMQRKSEGQNGRYREGQSSGYREGQSSAYREGQSGRYGEVRNRGARITDNTLLYYPSGSLQRPHQTGSPKHTGGVPHSQPGPHGRRRFSVDEEWDLTPTPSQSSQSSYEHGSDIRGGGSNYSTDPQSQGYVTSSLNEEYPRRVPWETSSAHSSQSDSTHVSGVSEPTYNRARPRTRPSSGRSRRLIIQPDPRRAMTPNPAAMMNRGEAWQLEDDIDGPKGATDYLRTAAPFTTVGHMDQALLPQKLYFSTSPSHTSHTSHTSHSSHSRQSSHSSMDTAPTEQQAGDHSVGGPHPLHKRHSYADSPVYRHSSGSSSRRSSQDFSTGDSFSPTQTTFQRRQSYASVDSSHSSGSRRNSISSPVRRSPSLQGHGLPDDSSPSVTETGGSRRIVSIVDQQVVAPEHMTGHVMSQRHTGSESSINKIKSKRKHQYEQVRARHPYEHVEQNVTLSQTDPKPLSQMSQQEELEPSNVKPKTGKGSPTFKRWKHSLTKKDNHSKSSQRQSLALNTSDSKLIHLSKKKQGAKNSPAPGKRFSASNLLDDASDDKPAIKLKNRMSSPEAQMLSRYFPNDLGGVQEGSSGSREQSPSDSDGTPPPKRSGRTKSAGTLVLHKIAKKFSKMSVKSASGDGGEASDGSGGGSTSWSAKKAARRKKLRSNSVSNLDCPDERSRLTQSMEQLNALSGDTPSESGGRFFTGTPGGTPTGTPKLTHSSSKTRLGRRGSEPDIEGALSNLFRSGSKRNLALDPTEALFDLIEQGNTEAVQQLLYSSMAADLNLSGTNEDDLMPLDLATMLNHKEVAKLLLEKGAKDSAKFCRDTFSRFSRIATLLMESERELDTLKHELVTQNFNNSSGLKDLERRLRKWEWKSHLLTKMKSNYEQAAVPGPPIDVSLHVTSNRSLTVTFSEPLESNGAVVTRYKIEWSRSEAFSPTIGEFVMTDLRSMEYVIPDLHKGEPYYVRVSAYNMKGFGPSHLASPSSAIPSSWHDHDTSQPRYEGKTNQMYTLAAELSMMLSNSSPLSPAIGSTPMVNRSTKTSLKKGITKLFGSAIKLHKTLKSGVYIASMVYSDDGKVLVSVDDHIPIIEVSDSHSSTVGADFVWLAKVACTWEHVRVMCDVSDNYTSSPAVQFRNKLLHAILDLQEALGMQDLGLLHPVPYKDKHGAIVFVIVQYLKEAKAPQMGTSSLKWSNLPRLWKRKSPLTSVDLDTLPVPDQIVFDAQEIIAYHMNSTRKLAKGLYLGYLKGRSTVASIKVICSREYPNVLPYMKIRDNPNISREEWQWFESLSFPPTSSSPHHRPTVTSGPQSLEETLLPKIETFLHNLGIAKEEISKHQLYRREAIELNEDITILLLLPPHEHVCTPPGSTDHFADLADFVALPINTFEIMQLYTYQRTFMSKYSTISARLEVELLTSQQRLREAFSNEDLKSAKQMKEELEKFQERAEQGWKQMRWIEEAVQKGRDQSDDTDSMLSIAAIREGITKAKEYLQQQQQLTANRRREREAGPPSQHSTGLASGYLRVFPSYATGLVKGTSVKLYITYTTTTAEVIRLVVHQLEKARLERGVPGPRITEEDLSDFYLVALSRNNEWALDTRANPLSLQSQSSMCRLEVRRRSEQFRLDELVTSV